MAIFDLLLRGGTVVDGTGGPGGRADVGVTGDRITALGDLSAVDVDGVAQVLDVTSLVVSPGFIDPHGHSDGSVLVDGALASHLHHATSLDPARYPIGIPHVIVNGRLAILDGLETGERPGRLLRNA